MKSNNKSSILFNLTISYIFVFFLVVGFVFVCSDREYNLNQQMARGYITSDSVFFIFDDPSIKPFGYDAQYSWQDDDSTNNTQKYNSNFILENSICDDGVTSIEKLLSSSKSDYFAALHRDTLRAVYYNGNIVLPPLISGRFFSENECLSKECYAVIGRNNEDRIYTENGKRYLNCYGRQYEVIGITGVASKSALDDMVFVNIGSLSPNEQLDGMYYVDGSKNNQKIYKEIASHSQDLFGCDMKVRKTPIAFIDIASGKIYMKNYLFIILLGLMMFSYINTERQYIERHRLKVSIMKLCGISVSKIIKETSKEYIISSLCGNAIGLIILIIMLVSGVFVLEYLYMMKVILVLFSFSILLLFFGVMTYSAIVYKIAPQEVLRKV